MWQNGDSSIHHGRVRRIHASDSPGDHFDEWLDPASWRAAVEPAASADLCQRHRRCDSLLVVGQSRHSQPLEYAFVLGLLLSYRAVVWVLPKIQSKKARFFRTGRSDVSVKAKA